VNTNKRPDCPKCGKPKLERQVSLFAATGKAKEDTGDADLPIDEARMERAVSELAGEADHINENDPRQAAGLMRKFSKMTGLELNSNMQEAMNRLEAGEDPEQVEQDMGSLLDGEEDPFILPEKKGAETAGKRKPPTRDNTLYEL
jgi:hypothetical protein